jgi:hypothetical protein
MRYLPEDRSLRTVYLIAVFAVIVFFLWLRGYIMTLNYSFNGLIEKVEYDEPKHIPTITVHGENYDLIYCHWNNYRDTLSVGDSVIKIKGEVGMSLIKK